MQHSRKIKRRFPGYQRGFRKNLIDPSQLVALRNPYGRNFGLIDPSQLVALRNPADIKEIEFDLWEGTLTQAEIANKHGVTQGYVSVIAKKAGMRGGAFKERRGRPINKGQVSNKINEEIKFDLWEGTLTQSEIADKYGMTQGHVSRIAKKVGLGGWRTSGRHEPIISREKISPTNEEIEFDLWEGTLTQSEIADKYGITQGYVSVIAKKAGLGGVRSFKPNPYISMFKRNPSNGFRRNPSNGFRRNPDPQGNPWGPKLYNPLGDSTHEFKDETHYQRMIAKLRRNPFRGY